MTERFPFADLEAYMVQRLGGRAYDEHGKPDMPGGYSHALLAEFLDLDAAAVRYWARRGWLHFDEVEAAAHGLSEHPGTIWECWWDVDCDDVPEPQTNPLPPAAAEAFRQLRLFVAQG